MKFTNFRNLSFMTKHIIYLSTFEKIIKIFLKCISRKQCLDQIFGYLNKYLENGRSFSNFRRVKLKR